MLTDVDAILTVGGRLAALRDAEVLVAGPDGFAAVDWALPLDTSVVAVGDDAIASLEHGDVMVASPSGQWVFDDLACGMGRRRRGWSARRRAATARCITRPTSTRARRRCSRTPPPSRRP